MKSHKIFIKQLNCPPKEYRSEHMTDRVQKSSASVAESQIYASERVGKLWLEDFLCDFVELTQMKAPGAHDGQTNDGLIKPPKDADRSV